MDLLTTVRKEGSRGGRGDFKWSDVQSSTHRENYLGHSLMAPVGRWQKGRDLNWYANAKGDTDSKEDEDPVQKAERERKEEIKRIKEAEQDALAKALGFEVAPRNPNTEALGDRKEVDKILKEATQEEEEKGGKGVGFGTFELKYKLPQWETGQGKAVERAEAEKGAGEVEVQKSQDIKTKNTIDTTTAERSKGDGLGREIENAGDTHDRGRHLETRARNVLTEPIVTDECIDKSAAVRPTARSAIVKIMKDLKAMVDGTDC